MKAAEGTGVTWAEVKAAMRATKTGGGGGAGAADSGASDEADFTKYIDAKQFDLF